MTKFYLFLFSSRIFFRDTAIKTKPTTAIAILPDVTPYPVKNIIAEAITRISPPIKRYLFIMCSFINCLKLFQHVNRIFYLLISSGKYICFCLLNTHIRSNAKPFPRKPIITSDINKTNFNRFSAR